jgi:hypothetical protein
LSSGLEKINFPKFNLIVNLNTPHYWGNINALALDSSIVKHIVRSYSTLDYHPKLLDLVAQIDPSADHINLCKLDLHRRINQVIVGHYPGEQVLKYNLFQEFRKKHLVAAFEMKVGTSRVDFVTINGHSTSFEIKSSLDRLDKLTKQTTDYALAFEYNYVVVDECHLGKIQPMIPDQFGIWTFKNGRKIIRKPATLNTAIDAGAQLKFLTKKELGAFFGINKMPADILKELSSELINEHFKKALKQRYQTRWSFITRHADIILPIDLQFFFNRNIHPDYIYR